MPDSTHKLIIETIHKNKEWFAGQPFAIWEVRDASHTSTSSVIRTFKQLIAIKMLLKSKKGYAGRLYRVGPRWPNTAKQAIEDFEFAKVLGYVYEP